MREIVLSGKMAVMFRRSLALLTLLAGCTSPGV